ncbi:DUF5337 domain-containing protein [Tabrizicola sp. YIM 78059]|uniref:DUF5337 domain-containing protein n=1 Tax=Tabrizicola sp. YIM 78059 TaxID=2529861 RepID=UPI0010AAB25E|nr:DUF5337 domain-containing protein [Tabrizicola sp. YIM 78059]
MHRPDPQDLKRAAQARLVGIVLAVTMLLWMGAQWLGGRLGWETRCVFLFDFAALAAFLWALVVTYQIWRGRRG